MHVLLVGPAPRIFGAGNFRWFSYTTRALERLGHTVSRFPCREAWLSSSALIQRVRWVPGASGQLARYRQALLHGRNRALIRLARRLRPDLIIVLKGDILPGEVLAEIKRAARGPLVTWWVDDPWRCPSFLPSFALFDHVFIFDRSYLPRLAELGVACGHFLPCACDETVYRPLQLSPAERRRYACEVAFVAWYFPERTPIVKALAGAVDLGVWGGQWDRSEVRHAGGGATVIRGQAVSDRTAATIYAASQIGLNVHQRQSRLGGLNTRTFEILASGLFQLVDQVGGIEELLTPGTEVVCYRSPEEVRRLATHYLADPMARLRIAARGRERVLDEHTYVCRMRTLCDLARGGMDRTQVPRVALLGSGTLGHA